VNATLPEMLERVTRADGDCVAIVDGNCRRTYAELADASSRIATGLADLGVRRGDLVALWLPNSLVWVELEFAIARLGAVAVGINTKLRSHDVSQLLMQSRASVLVAWPGFKGIDFLGMVGQIADTVPDSLRLVFVGDHDTAEVAASLRSRVTSYDTLLQHSPMTTSAAAPDLPSNVFSSSGTTSAPKLVLHCQSALVTHAEAVAKSFGYAASDTVVLGMLPFCGVFGFNTLTAALAAGRPLVVQAAFDADDAVALIERYKITHTNGADEMLRRILTAARPVERIASLREAGFANFGGDARPLVQAAAEVGKKFFQTYGASEVQALMCYPPVGSDAGRWSVGGGVPVSECTHARVRDVDTGELVGDGIDGEIEISGPNVTVGYMGRPDLTTKSRTEDGWWRTGDFGRLADGRDFIYLARLGDALRLGGFLVGVSEIEGYLETLAGVTAAQVVGVCGNHGDVAVAFVIGEGLDEAALLQQCRSELARFKVPRCIAIVEEFPMTHGANGDKIQRVQLRAMAADLLAEREEIRT